MRKGFIFVLTIIAAFNLLALGQSNEELAKQVRDTESAFAQTIKARNFKNFVSFISEEAVFITDDSVKRGKKAVAESWKVSFDSSDDQFSWKPEKVEVLDSGMLALSNSTILNLDGKRSGTLSFIWRREADGKWKIIFNERFAVNDQNFIDSNYIEIKSAECYSKPKPVYPKLAKKARINGDVVVEAMWANGKITKARVITSPGESFGFDDAALDAIKKWKCTSVTLDGKPLILYGYIEVHFEMSNTEIITVKNITKN